MGKKTGNQCLDCEFCHLLFCVILPPLAVFLVLTRYQHLYPDHALPPVLIFLICLFSVTFTICWIIPGIVFAFVVLFITKGLEVCGSDMGTEYDQV